MSQGFAWLPLGEEEPLKQREWQPNLQRIAVVLGALLILLVSLVLLYILLQVLLRFGNVLALFILGALVAYILNPAVTWIAARAGKRWVGALLVYAGAAATLAVLALLLLQPLVNESSSLIQALRNPTAGSTQALSRVSDRSRAVGGELQAQRVLAREGAPIPLKRVNQIQTAVAGIQDELTALGAAPVHARAHTSAAKRNENVKPQIEVPPSYLAPLQASIAALGADYRRALRDPASPAVPALTRSIADAKRLTLQAQALHWTLSTTPILLLDAQTWADQHGIAVDVTQSAGQVGRQISSQISSLLDNTAAILSQTAGLLLDVVLVLIISVYFVIDGERMVQGAVALVPDAYHRQATFFLTSLDSVLGGYIRAQILLALLAGLLAGVGAAALGVPFALIIGFSTFMLQLLPVVGAMLVYIVPMIIALLFTSMPTPLVLLAYFIIFEQVVTNVIGPRVNSKSVGIHPLEAMAAALLAYPIAGVLGSFLAVPTAGLLHVMVGEAYRSRRAASRSPEDAAASASHASVSDEASVPVREPAAAGNPSPTGTSLGSM